MNMIYDVIIIGAGPGGMSAAVYASRSNLKTLLLDKDAPGGKMLKTSEVENWPGMVHVTGPDLAFQMFEHSTSFGAVYEYGNVQDILNEGKIKKVVCEDQTYETYAVIIATGTKERKIGIPGEDEFYGKGVSYCAVCDGALYKNKEIMVIGGGNSALEEALYLTKFVQKVYLVHRREDFRAEEFIIDNVKKNSKIELVLKSIPLEILGNQTVERVKIKNIESNQEKIISVSAVFPFVGLDPESRFAVRLGICNDFGYINSDQRMMTSIEGIYAVGDVKVKELRQIVTACSDGAIAANHASHYIDKIKRS